MTSDDELKNELKKIYDAWFGSVSKPKLSFVNFTINKLKEKGYNLSKSND